MSAKIFSKIGLAITFSPTGVKLLKEASRLQKLFESELILIHAGEKTDPLELQMKEAITSAGISDYTVIWKKGDPAEVILKEGKSNHIDLLIAGALEKENLFKFYFGSVARKIMREYYSSSLIITAQSEASTAFKNFYVAADYSARSEKTIRKAYEFALKENADEFVVIRDFNVPGLTASMLDSATRGEIENLRDEWTREEEMKMKLFVNELGLTGIDIKIVCLYGKEGLLSGKYAEIKNADIFGVTGPSKKIKFIHRLFPNKIEFLFEKLPCNLLIIK